MFISCGFRQHLFTWSIYFCKKAPFQKCHECRTCVVIIGFEHLFAHSKNTSKKNKLKSIKSSHPEDCALKCLQENLNPFLAKIPILLYCPYCPYNLLCCRTLESIDINDENNDTGKFVKPLIFYDIAKSYKKCLDSVFLTAEIRTD